MNLERIAEIEADLTSGFGPGWPIETNEEAAELCRLARLGLRVEGSPTAMACPLGTRMVGAYAWEDVGAFVYATLPDGARGKRVALVVLEESK